MNKVYYALTLEYSFDQAFSNLAVYSGTKFFEEAVSEALRQEIATHGIKVSCIQPGDVSTGLHQKSVDQEVCVLVCIMYFVCIRRSTFKF